MFAFHDSDIILKLRDHYANNEKRNQGIARDPNDTFRQKAIAIREYDPDSGTYFPGAGQGDIQCSTFWPAPLNVTKKAGSSPSVNPKPDQQELMSAFAFTYPAMIEAYKASLEVPLPSLQGVQDLYALIKPIRNLGIDLDNRYIPGRSANYEDDPNPPVRGQQAPSPIPPGFSTPTSGAVTVSTTPRPPGGPSGGSTQTFSKPFGQTDLGEEHPDMRVHSSPLPGSWPAQVTAGTEKDGHHPITLPAFLNLLISDYQSGEPFVDKNTFSTRIADLVTDSGRVDIDHDRISTIASALRVCGMVDRTGRSTALAWNVPPGVELGGRGQFMDSGYLGAFYAASRSRPGNGNRTPTNPQGGPSTLQPGNTGNVTVERNRTTTQGNPPGITIPSDLTVGYAGRSGGGPISPGHISCRHYIGIDQDLRAHQQGHIDGMAPIDYGLQFDAPNLHQGERIPAVNEEGVFHDVRYVHDSELIHPTAGRNFQGGTARGRHRWQIPLRMYPLPDPPPPWEQIDPFLFFPAPFANPEDKGGDPNNSTLPRWREIQEMIQNTSTMTEIISRASDIGWTGNLPVDLSQTIENVFSPWPHAKPGSDFTPGEDNPLYQKPKRFRGRLFPFGPGKPRVSFKEIINKYRVCDTRRNIRLYNEVAMPVIAAMAYPSGWKDILYKKTPDECDLNRIERSLVPLVMEAWAAETAPLMPTYDKTAKQRFASRSGNGGFNILPGTESSDGRATAGDKAPNAFFNFGHTNSYLSFGDIVTKGENAGTVQNGLAFHRSSSGVVSAVDSSFSEKFSWDSSGNFAASGIVTTDSVKLPIATVAGGAGTYNATAGERIKIQSSLGAKAIQLPDPANHVGERINVKDMDGSAGTNNITVTTAAGKIDGVASKVLNSNYQSVTFESDGSNWGIV